MCRVCSYAPSTTALRRTLFPSTETSDRQRGLQGATRTGGRPLQGPLGPYSLFDIRQAAPALDHDRLMRTCPIIATHSAFGKEGCTQALHIALLAEPRAQSPVDCCCPFLLGTSWQAIIVAPSTDQTVWYARARACSCISAWRPSLFGTCSLTPKFTAAV